VARPGRSRKVAALLRARDAAERNYGRHPHVLGVSAGRKFRRGRATQETHCIQFFVTRKVREPQAIRRRLPRFVYGRRADGSPLRSLRIPTDVIAVGRIEPACSAGSPVSGLGEAGGMTLLFRNRNESSPGAFLALTCAHVVGDLSASRPLDPYVSSACCPQVNPFGEVVAGTLREAALVRYDIAAIRLSERAQADCPLQDRRTRLGTRLNGFYPPHEIRPGTFVSCDFPISNVPSASVESFPGSVRMRVGSRLCTIQNAFLLRAPVRKGDSGGLLFQGDRAVGILFGRSPRGWGWFHALRDAVEHLNATNPHIPFEIF
jgi:hypothetical protein